MAEQGQAPGTGRPKGRPDKPTDRPAEPRAATAGGNRPGETGDTQPENRPRGIGDDKQARPESVGRRPERYLVAPTGWASTGLPTDPATAGQQLIEAMQRNPDLHVLRVIRSAASESSEAPTQRSPYPAVAVVETTHEQAAILAARPEFHVDIDHPLRHGEQLPVPPMIPGTGTLDQSVTVRLRVRDERDEPLRDAAVYVYGGLYPVVGRTDGNGGVELAVPADSLEAVRGVYVRPRADCWSVMLDSPFLSATEVNPVVCRRLDSAPREVAGDGWARRVMNFDRIPPTYRGHGVRIAVIGSGVDAGRLGAAEGVMSGINVVGQDEKAWDSDTIGRSTHTVALITGVDGDQAGGLAPEAEVHVCRALPGRLSDLIEAIDYCIAQEVDVIDLGVYADGVAGLVAYKLEEARQAGILCVAAAGDTGGPVTFPGTLAPIFTVGAIGQVGTYPPESHHAAQQAGMPTREGFYVARSSCAGPEVDVCAPGVAVISAVGTEGRAALDGTPVAATHIAALAGLVLAHHPDFRYGFGMRGPARVQRLAELIKASCRPMPGTDPYRCGAGVPDAAVAVGLVPQWASYGAPQAAGVPFAPPAPAAPAQPPAATLAAAIRAAGYLLPDPDE
ncbi:S8 family serine peptidase [Actinoplanes sp. NPDC051346]|uniref:S8 family serine peptidase n=1 Tax=Actinoplanes sp. NPDC051346 TaxID=3155048 RepID=UPI00343FCE62